jgi:hypothetical protein
MKLFITDFADPSVGLFQASYDVVCPFEKEDVHALSFFKEEIKKIYSEFAEGKVVAEYDFERLDRNESEIPEEIEHDTYGVIED